MVGMGALGCVSGGRSVTSLAGETTETSLSSFTSLSTLTARPGIYCDARNAGIIP